MEKVGYNTLGGFMRLESNKEKPRKGINTHMKKSRAKVSNIHLPKAIRCLPFRINVLPRRGRAKGNTISAFPNYLSGFVPGNAIEVAKGASRKVKAFMSTIRRQISKINK